MNNLKIKELIKQSLKDETFNYSSKTYIDLSDAIVEKLSTEIKIDKSTNNLFLISKILTFFI